MSLIDIYEASLTLGIPEFLVRDFVKYGFNRKKLSAIHKGSGAYEFQADEVQSFLQHLESSWPGNERASIPEHIQRYVKYEAQGVCAFCQMQRPNYEYAHIHGWSQTRCHSPHNILYLCLDCHKTYGNDTKLLKNL